MSDERDPKGWIQTYTGRKVWPLDPRPEDFEIEDVAHALANLCRFTGHTKHFYSVAQHSVLVAHACPKEFRLEGLMHDAAEAYLADVARPVKRAMERFIKPIEERLERAIAKRFDLVYPWPAEVKANDNRALAAERRDVMSDSQPWRSIDCFFEPFSETISPWRPDQAKVAFLRWFETWRRT